MGKKRWPVFAQKPVVKTPATTVVPSDWIDATAFGETTKTYFSNNSFSGNWGSSNGWSSTVYPAWTGIGITTNLGTTTINANAGNIGFTIKGWAPPPWATWALVGYLVSVYGGPFIQDRDLDEHQVIYGDATRIVVEWL